MNLRSRRIIQPRKESASNDPRSLPSIGTGPSVGSQASEATHLRRILSESSFSSDTMSNYALLMLHSKMQKLSKQKQLHFLKKLASKTAKSTAELQFLRLLKSLQKSIRNSSKILYSRSFLLPLWTTFSTSSSASLFLTKVYV